MERLRLHVAFQTPEAKLCSIGGAKVKELNLAEFHFFRTKLRQIVRFVRLYFLISCIKTFNLSYLYCFCHMKILRYISSTILLTFETWHFNNLHASDYYYYILNKLDKNLILKVILHQRNTINEYLSIIQNYRLITKRPMRI